MAFAIEIKQIFVVDPSGGERGSFKTIQGAIDASPELTKNEGKWNCIRIKQGIYRERVNISRHKPWTYLEGAGMRDTHVVSDGNHPSSAATLITQAENLLVKGISFINSYNAVGSKNDMTQAAAGKIEGDRSAFFDCGFFGLQDTLWDHSGRHYFHNCTIEGAVDFIYGAGQSIYEKCKISVVAERLNGTASCITAHAREKPEDNTAFVFKYCTVTGNGKTNLGRPWRAYARVVFYKTSMSEIILPQGWTIMSSNSDVDTATFQEIECTGLGAAKEGRVQWSNKPMSKTELERFLSLQKYINEEGWIPRHLN